MSRVEQLLTDISGQLSQLCALLERQAAPVELEYYRQLVTAPEAVVKQHNRDVLTRARKRLKAAVPGGR